MDPPPPTVLVTADTGVSALSNNDMPPQFLHGRISYPSVTRSASEDDDDEEESCGAEERRSAVHLSREVLEVLTGPSLRSMDSSNRRNREEGEATEEAHKLKNLVGSPEEDSPEKAKASATKVIPTDRTKETSPRNPQCAKTRENPCSELDAIGVGLQVAGAYSVTPTEQNNPEGESQQPQNEQFEGEQNAIVAELVDQDEKEAAQREIERLKRELAAAQQALAATQNTEVAPVVASPQALGTSESLESSTYTHRKPSKVLGFLGVFFKNKKTTKSKEQQTSKESNHKGKQPEDRQRTSSKKSKAEQPFAGATESYGPSPAARVVAELVAAKNRQASTEAIIDLFASRDMGIQFEDGAVLPVAMFAAVCQGCFASFPDLTFRYDAITDVQSGEVLLDNYIVEGTHTGAPFSFMHFPAVRTTNKHVVNDPERVYFKVNEEGKISSMRIFFLGTHNGPQGLYVQVGGKLEL